MITETRISPSRPIQQSLFPKTAGRPIKYPDLVEWIAISLCEDPSLSPDDLFTRRPSRYKLLARRTFDEYYKRAKRFNSTGWMHGRQKLRARAESRSFCAKYLDKPIKSRRTILSLPYDRIFETTYHFGSFKHIDRPRYLFFEKNIKRAHDMLSAIEKDSPKNVTIVIGDLFTNMGLIENKSVAIFDLDFMSTATDKLMKAVRSLIVQKADPEASFIFLNTSYGRSITLSATKLAHMSLIVGLRAYFSPMGKRIYAIHRKYRDTYPMYSTSIVIRGE